MAGKGDSYNNALGSIFDFAFASGKDKGTLRPTPPSGLSSSESISSALTLLAQRPFDHLDSAAIDSVKDTFLDASIVEFQLDRMDSKKYPLSDPNTGRFRVRAKESDKILLDPIGYMKGVQDKMKKERKLMRAATLGGWVDAAIAAKAAKKAGLPSNDWIMYGDAARGDSNSFAKKPGDFTSGNNVVASNASMIAEINLAKDYVENTLNISVDDPTFATKVQDRLRTRTGNNQRNDALLRQALQTTSATRGMKFYGKLDTGARPESPQAAIAEAKSNKGLVDPKVWENEAQGEYEKARIDYIEGRKSILESKRSAFKSIEKHLRDNNVPDSEVRAIMKGLDEEMNAQITQGISAHRMNLSRNAMLRANFTNDPEELARLGSVYGMTTAWERIKGDDEAVYLSAKNNAGVRSINEINSDLKTLKGELAELRNSGADQSVIDSYQSHMSFLQDERKGLKKLNDEVLSKQMKGQSVLSNGAMFRDPRVSGYVKVADRKYADAIKNHHLSYQQAKFEFMAVNAKDPLERRYYMMMARNFADYKEKVALVPGTDRRVTWAHRAHVATSFRENILNGGYMGSFMSGTMFEIGDPIAPGARQDASYSTGKAIFDEDGNFKGYEKLYDTSLIMGRGNVNPIYRSLTTMYYLTPGSILKTVFVNGEGFGYMANWDQERVFRAVTNDRLGLIKNFLQDKQSDPKYKMFFTDGELDPEKIGQRYFELISLLSEDKRVPKSLRAAVSRLKFLKGRGDIFAKAHHFYIRMNFAGRIKDRLKYQLTNNRMVRMFHIRRNRFLRKLFKNNVIWKETVGHFISGKAGVRQLVRAGLIALAQSANLAIPGLGVIAGFIADKLTDFAMWVGRYMLGFVVLLIFGFCGICAMLGLLLGTIFGGENTVSANLAPDEYEVCEYKNPYDFGDYEQPGGPGEVLYAEGDCPIGDGSIYCGQSPYGRYSHTCMGSYAIDVSRGASETWAAPMDGRVVSYVSTNICPTKSEDGSYKNYGGILLFVDDNGNSYRLIHVDLISGLGPVKKGRVVAQMSRSLEPGPCWSKAHYHLDVKNSSSSWVNALDWYRELGCDISGCDGPPRTDELLISVGEDPADYCPYVEPK